MFSSVACIAKSSWNTFSWKCWSKTRAFKYVHWRWHKTLYSLGNCIINLKPILCSCWSVYNLQLTNSESCTKGICSWMWIRTLDWQSVESWLIFADVPSCTDWCLWVGRLSTGCSSICCLSVHRVLPSIYWSRRRLRVDWMYQSTLQRRWLYSAHNPKFLGTKLNVFQFCG